MICGTAGCEREVELGRSDGIPELVHTDDGSVECRVGTCQHDGWPVSVPYPDHGCRFWTPCTATVAKEVTHG